MYRYISVYTDPYICPVLPSPIALPPCPFPMLNNCQLCECVYVWVGGCARARTCACVCVYACMCVCQRYVSALLDTIEVQLRCNRGAIKVQSRPRLVALSLPIMSD